MRAWKFYFIATIACAISSAAIAQTKEVFACIEHQSGGFEVENRDRLKLTAFQPVGFTMVRAGNKLSVRRLNWTTIYSCRNVWNRENILQCAEDFYFIVFDTKGLRFTRAQMYSYIDNSKDGLLITYGDCQRL